MFGPKWPAEITPKAANIVSGRSIALEGMSPTDGLLAGIVGLPTCPAGPLRDAVFIVVGNLDMKA